MPELEQKTPKMAKQIIFILIALIAGTALGLAGCRYWQSRSNCLAIAETADVKTASDCQAKLEKVKKFFPIIPEMTSIFGVIKEINGQVITMESALNNPLENLPLIRKVTVKDDAKIVKFKQKDQAIYQKEAADYQKAIAERTETDQIINPPMPFVEEIINFLDLKIGDQIVAESGENIKTKDEFEAIKITLQTAPIAGLNN